MRHPDKATAVVLLAAGRGERFGGAKLQASFRGRPLWEWAAMTAETFAFRERIVVIAPGGAIGSRDGWTRTENSNAVEGMGSSIAAGVSLVSKSERVLILLGDMPLVSPDLLERLMATQGVAFSRYEHGTPGCPAIFPRATFGKLKGLSGERGARSLDLGQVSLVSPADKMELADIDTAHDLQRLMEDSAQAAPPPT